MDLYKQMKLALLCLVWMVTLASGFHIKPNASARRGKKNLHVAKDPTILMMLLFELLSTIFIIFH